MQVWFRIDEKNRAVESFPNDPDGLFHPSLHWEQGDDEVVNLNDVWTGSGYRSPTSEDDWETVDEYKEELVFRLESLIEVEERDVRRRPTTAKILNDARIRLNNKKASNNANRGNAPTKNERKMFDHVELIHARGDDIMTSIEGALTHSELDALDVQNPNFPIWVPPEE